MQPLHRRRVPGNAAQNILARPVRDVLVHPQFGPFLLAQKFLVLQRQIEGELAKKKYPPALGHLAIRPRARFVLLGSDPTAGHPIIFHKNKRLIRHRFSLYLDAKSANATSFAIPRRNLSIAVSPCPLLSFVSGVHPDAVGVLKL